MTRPPTGSALLVLAEEVSCVHAEVGASAVHTSLAAAVDAVAHALVDLADGREHPSRHTALHDLPGGDEQVGAASCAAAAAAVAGLQLRARRLLTGPDGIPPGLAEDTIEALGLLAGALRDLAGQGGQTQLRAVQPTAHRAVRRCHRMLQPATLGS